MKFDGAQPSFAPAAPSAYIHRMPKGPQGQKRPADVIGAAIRVARIATGEEADDPMPSQKAEAGSIGGKNRAKTLSPERRTEIARQAARKRHKDSA